MTQGDVSCGISPLRTYPTLGEKSGFLKHVQRWVKNVDFKNPKIKNVDFQNVDFENLNPEPGTQVMHATSFLMRGGIADAITPEERLVRPTPST